MAAVPGPRVTVLSGGVGGARFLHGLVQLVSPADVTVIGNVGDDFEPYGLHVSPDLDTVLYTLTGTVDEEQGWGVRGDSEHALDEARRLGDEAWFRLGDRDLGLHLARAGLLRAGHPLSAATAELARRAGLAVRLLPVTDDRLRTVLETEAGTFDFQTYYVRRRHSDVVRAVRFDGADAAAPAPGVVEALRDAEVVLIAPSNPVVSIGPILAVPGVRAALEARRSPTVAVSPIVAGRALRGPAASMLASLGPAPTPVGVASLYAGLCDALVLDEADAGLAGEVEALGLLPVVADTVMRDVAGRRRLAAAALDAARRVGARG